MKKIVVLIVLVLPGIFTNGQKSSLSFEISVEPQRIYLMEPFELTFFIHDTNFKYNIKQEGLMVTENNYYINNFSSGFTHKVKIVPIKPGRIKIGPYSINYQGMTLNSNEIFIDVLMNDQRKTLFFDVPSKVKVGSEGTIKIQSAGDLRFIELKESEYFTIEVTSSSTSVSIEDGKEIRKSTSEYTVKFKKPGKLVLSKEMIVNFPESLAIEPVTIEIE